MSAVVDIPTDDLDQVCTVETQDSEPEIIIEHESCDCEGLHRYKRGGYHPVVVSQVICERYEILHKLGYGGTATVWLARDHNTGRNVALKILSADNTATSGQRELSAYTYLQSSLSGDQRDLIVLLHDSFYSESPNGNHLCLVLELSGPSLANIVRRDASFKLRPDMAQQLSLDLARGLETIHKAGIIYHDFSPSNILLQLDESIATMSVSELYGRLGPPDAHPLHQDELLEGSVAPGPTHVYTSLDFTKPENLNLIKPTVKFIDFAEIDYVGQRDVERPHGLTLLYTDPETLFLRSMQEQASDIWSLACIMFELRAADTLLAPSDTDLGAVRNGIRDCLGAAPEGWEEKLKEDKKARGIEAVEAVEPYEVPTTSGSDEHDWSAMASQLRKFEEDDRPRTVLQKARHMAFRLKQAIKTLLPSRPDPIHYWVEDGLQREGQSLEDTIRSIGTWTPWCHMTVEERVANLKALHKDLNTRNVKITREECDTGEPPHGPMSEREVQDFLDLLSGMLTWHRGNRASLEQVLEHRWFTTDYEGDKDKPWVQKYHRGFQYWSNGKPIM